MTRQEVYGFLDKMSRVALITPVQLEINAIPEDPANNIIIACALEGGAALAERKALGYSRMGRYYEGGRRGTFAKTRRKLLGVCFQRWIEQKLI